MRFTMTATKASTVPEGPNKGQAYFNRARTVAETGNYDYAIDMYIEGLLREPSNLKEHEALRDVALRRKIKGGRPAGRILGGKPYFHGKSSKEQMLNAERLLAKDPGNIALMMTVLRHAVAGGFRDVALWLAPMAVLANRNLKSPNPKTFLDLADIFEALEDYAQAGQVMLLAQELLPKDGTIPERIQSLAARETLQKGQYESSTTDFKESLRDKALTRTLLEKESLAQTEEYKQQAVREAQIQYEANPTDQPTIAKYVKTLLDLETEETENRAIEVLQDAWQRTQTYRYKVYIGDVRMKQYHRQIRILREAVKAHAGDTALSQELHKLEAECDQFELQEYKERMRNFPSDAAICYEYGRRLYDAKRYDEAIAVLQQAQNSPRYRSDALYMLGRAFLEQSMHQEAVDTLQRAIEGYELASTGDAKSKEMHYWLGRALEATRQNAAAEKTYSQIAQWDIKFRDARERLADLRRLKANHA